MLASSSLLPSALTGLPTAAVVGVLCAAVIVEIVALPTVLPGATITLLAGALIGAGRPLLAVVIPLTLAVVAGDQLAYFGGAALTSWWRRRRPGRDGPRAARPGLESWFAAAVPSLAGAAGLRYRQFTPRVLILRVPWLAAALTAGALAAKSVARLGHVIGIIGIVATALVLAVLLLARHRSALPRVFLTPAAPKAPASITPMFWAVSLLSTAGGGVTSDYLLLGHRAAGVAVEAGLLVIAAAAQFRTRRYNAPAFWFLAYATAIFATGVCDTLHRAGLPYGGALLVWAGLLAAVLTVWYRAGLSVRTVDTRRAEAWYWVMTAVTIAFGIALADFAASALHLGYLPAVAVFAAASAIPALDRCLGLGSVTTFWWAYVLIRPLGAAVADYVSQAPSASGLGFGDARTALLTALALGAAVACSASGRRKIPE